MRNFLRNLATHGANLFARGFMNAREMVTHESQSLKVAVEGLHVRRVRTWSIESIELQ